VCLQVAADRAASKLLGQSATSAEQPRGPIPPDDHTVNDPAMPEFGNSETDEPWVGSPCIPAATSIREMPWWWPLLAELELPRTPRLLAIIPAGLGCLSRGLDTRCRAWWR